MKGDGKMLKKSLMMLIMILLLILMGCGGGSSSPSSSTVDTSPPGSAVKLIFIHHSTGQNWLQTGYGNLGQTLNTNHYFVSDTNYGWDDPDPYPVGHTPRSYRYS
jgi:hypothetical protein